MGSNEAAIIEQAASVSGNATPMFLIKKEVARSFGIEYRQLESPSRKHNLAKPRQIAMWLCRTHTRASLPMIGRAFKRHHTTVLHAIDAVNIMRDRNQNFAALLCGLSDRCQNFSIKL